MDNSKIRVLIVEDSLTMRKEMAGIFERTEDFDIAGEAGNGKEAIRQAKKLAPDVIVMDVVMPVMSGLAAVEYIMSHMPLPIVIHSSFLNSRESDMTRDATASGALTALDKSEAERDRGKWEKNLIRTVRAASRVRTRKRVSSNPLSSPAPVAERNPSNTVSNGKKIRALVVDDSLTVRESVKAILREAPDIDVAGEAKNGSEAIDETARLVPDVILMDIVMPVMSGLAAVEYIMAHMPVPIVIHSSFGSRGESHKTWDAEMAGALAALDKSDADKDPSKWEKNLIRTVRAASRVRVSARPANSVPSGKSVSSKACGYNLVAFGISMGGPAIIARILKSLPSDFDLPVLLVIHIPRSDEGSFSAWLARNCNLEVRVATDGEIIHKRKGCVFVAPINRHMTVKNGRIGIVDTPPANFCKPSVDVLFHSLAADSGAKPIAVLLTGMGQDGAKGLKAIRDAGGYTICQDEATSIVFGMPRAGIEMGGASIVLPDYRIAGEIMALSNESLKGCI